MVIRACYELELLMKDFVYRCAVVLLIRKRTKRVKNQPLASVLLYLSNFSNSCKLIMDGYMTKSRMLMLYEVALFLLVTHAVCVSHYCACV